VPIFGLNLTVCREAVQGYSEEVSNRLVRKLLRNPGFTPESFLRVEVAEEDGQTFFGADLIGDVENHFRSRIMAGIKLHGRVYQFLAYSSSQLKTNSFWMIHAPRDWPVTRIRSDLGDFSRCKSASLYAARVGQCLSTTFEGSANTNMRRPYAVGKVEDLSTPGAMIHSDGTGLISRDAMAKLVENLPFGPPNSADASIVQVRIGGAKGTLTSWDFQTLSHISASCYKRDVLLRPSMIKFDADYSSLEVCKVGSRTTYHLNRHVILLLATQGVPQDNFIKMQREIIEDICEMVRNREKAIDLLSFLPGPDSKQRGVLLNMLKYGLNPSTEPFVFSSLISMLLHNLSQLCKKARIPVRQGAVVYGRPRQDRPSS
jgi:RNA-dependent RNA polymerase